MFVSSNCTENIPLRGNRHNKQRLPGVQNASKGKPEVRVDDFQVVLCHGQIREGHHQVEKVADNKEEETLVEGCGSEISSHLIS